MRLGDILYFAPGIRFDQVDLDGANLPAHFKRRIVGFYLEPAKECARNGFAFASGVLLVSCLDALARLRFCGGVGKRFRKFAISELRSFSAATLAERFYDEFRNGLVHEARLKNGAQFAREIGATVESRNGILLVNPDRLAVELCAALDSYVKLLTFSARERKKLASTLRQDLAEDFRVSRA